MRERIRRIGPVAATVLAFAVAVLAFAVACTGGGSDTAADSSAPAAPGTDQTSPEVSGQAAIDAAASASPNSTLSTPLPELTAREIQFDGIRLRLAVNDLTTGGASTRLMLTLTNVAAVNDDGITSFQIGATFSDGVRNGDSPLTQDTSSIDGIYLLDPTAAKRYLPGRNADDGCVCTGNTTAIILEPGDSSVLTGIFAPLPDTVSSIDVQVPQFGTFSDIPVQR